MRTHYIGRTPKIYYWVKYRVGDKFGLLGAYNSEEEANEDAINELHGAANFEIIALDTKNQAAASRKLKKVTLSETKDIGLAMQRMKRIPPSNTQPYRPPMPIQHNQAETDKKPFLLM